MKRWLQIFLFIPFLKRLRRIVSNKVHRWFLNRLKRQSGWVKLHRKTTYVLPTHYGLVFGFILFVMLMGSINYSNSMGFLLTFLLAGIVLVTMLYSYRNLIGLAVAPGKAVSVFAGDTANFSLTLTNSEKTPSYAIRYGMDKQSRLVTDVPPLSPCKLDIPVKTESRGLYRLQPLRVWTEFPLGLFHIWSWVYLDMTVIVYPKPTGKPLNYLVKSSIDGEKRLNTNNDDDYSGMRKYQNGDSPKHIAWKAVAKGHDLQTKQFAGLSGQKIWLDWYSLTSLEIEQRLSQLCLWVLEAHRSQLNYGLRLPDHTFEPASGERHKYSCLEALALYGLKRQ